MALTKVGTAMGCIVTLTVKLGVETPAKGAMPERCDLNLPSADVMLLFGCSFVAETRFAGRAFDPAALRTSGR